VAGVRGVVLAAGRGIRMGGTRPKTLLRVGEREPLLHYLLRGLERAGIADLLVVTGFSAAEVQSFVEANWKRDVAFTRNPRYASWGNFHSVRLAIDASPGRELLVVNSDIAIHPRVFRRAREEYADLVLAVEARRRLTPEDMRVSLDGATVTGIGKGLDMKRSHGEFAGVSLLRPPAAALFVDIATRLEWTAETSLYYEDLYARLLGSCDVRAVPVAAGEYAEVDEPADVERAGAVLDAHASAWDQSVVGEPA
jgi:choline kinase